MALITTSKAAAQLGVHPATLWRWQQAGSVRPAFITPGGQARWDLDDLATQLSARKDVPMAAESSRPEPQPVVAAIVTSHDGVLIGKRNDGKPPWTFIAGEIEPGEAPVDAAIREVKEETGLLVTAAEQEIGRRVHPKTGRTMIYLACYPTASTNVFVGDEEELAEVRWVKHDQAHELLPGMFEPVAKHLRTNID